MCFGISECHKLDRNYWSLGFSNALVEENESKGRILVIIKLHLIQISQLRIELLPPRFSTSDLFFVVALVKLNFVESSDQGVDGEASKALPSKTQTSSEDPNLTITLFAINFN